VCCSPRGGTYPFPTRRSSDLGDLDAVHPVPAEEALLRGGDGDQHLITHGEEALGPGGHHPHHGEGDAADADGPADGGAARLAEEDRKSTRLNSSHVKISYAVF